MTPDAESARRMRLILELRQNGITDARLLSAIERTNRAQFAPAHMEALGWDDLALPIEREQVLTKPSLIAQLLLHLNVRPEDNVLEIGTGSGYQAAILARLAARVTSVERHRPLVEAARRRLSALSLSNAHAEWGDGADGWELDAPFDRIIVNACGHDFMPAVLYQLAIGGLMLAPIGEEEQRLKRVRREGDADFKVEDLGPIKMGYLEAGVAE